MRQFLFPTDFSEESKESFAMALRFSEKYGERLMVFNSYYSTQSPKRTFLSEGTLEDEAHDRLKKFIATTDNNRNIPITVKAIEGFAVRNIIELSKKKSVDLVITNLRNRYEWIDKVMGTRISYICSGSYCPTLILPKKYSFKPIKNILIKNDDFQKSQRFMQQFLKYKFGDFQSNQVSINQIEKGLGEIERSSKSISFWNRLNKYRPSRFIKLKKKLKTEINERSPDLLVLVLNQENLVQQTIENRILLPIILQIDIPTLIINQNTIKARNINKSKSIDLKFLKYSNPRLAINL